MKLLVYSFIFIALSACSGKKGSIPSYSHNLPPRDKSLDIPTGDAVVEEVETLEVMSKADYDDADALWSKMNEFRYENDPQIRMTISKFFKFPENFSGQVRIQWVAGYASLPQKKDNEAEMCEGYNPRRDLKFTIIAPNQSEKTYDEGDLVNVPTGSKLKLTIVNEAKCLEYQVSFIVGFGSID